MTIWGNPWKNKVLVGAERSGKSYNLIQHIAELAKLDPERKFIIFADRTEWEALQDLLGKDQVEVMPIASMPLEQLHDAGVIDHLAWIQMLMEYMFRATGVLKRKRILVISGEWASHSRRTLAYTLIMGCAMLKDWNWPSVTLVADEEVGLFRLKMNEYALERGDRFQVIFTEQRLSRLSERVLANCETVLIGQQFGGDAQLAATLSQQAKIESLLERAEPGQFFSLRTGEWADFVEYEESAA